ncbi:hypothetical protein [Agrococcus jejuensis]|uniref:Uncharacterized protein n=1 Tax=Agrococcus jejuensis TaxID=399736 RepID=A0A1G8DZU0_9MICO|nr:hypothetical protein [Agrococcus jejuensis]SDH62969.1 hypothetical protein SAMN04489720_1832 [Agrococcus jejuensis]
MTTTAECTRCADDRDRRLLAALVAIRAGVEAIAEAVAEDPRVRHEEPGDVGPTAPKAAP